MRIDVRKPWKRIKWVGPDGETGNGTWLPNDDIAQDHEWCTLMNAAYPGWVHFIESYLGTPQERSPEGWVLHPLFGDMQHGPMGL